MHLGISLAAAIFLAFIVPGGHLLQFTSSSPPDGHTVYACTGSEAQFPWQLSLISGENVTRVLWFHGANNTSPQVGQLSGGQFVVMPKYNQRVSRLHNAGLRISNISTADQGTYLVEVRGHDPSGKLKQLQSTLVLRVKSDADAPVVSGGQLQVKPSPSLHKRSGKWQFGLTCGPFSSRGDPPVNVTWTTPSGSTMPSSSYNKGKYVLLLDEPVRGGHYTCRVPQAAPAAVCLSPSDNLLRGASVAVEEWLARLAFLEAKQDDLQAENDLLKKQLEQEHESTVQLQTEGVQLNQRLQQLDTEDAMLKRRLLRQENKTNKLQVQTRQLGDQIERLERKTAAVVIKNVASNKAASGFNWRNGKKYVIPNTPSDARFLTDTFGVSQLSSYTTCTSFRNMWLIDLEGHYVIASVGLSARKPISGLVVVDGIWASLVRWKLLEDGGPRPSDEVKLCGQQLRFTAKLLYTVECPYPPPFARYVLIESYPDPTGFCDVEVNALVPGKF